jgi:hypothetical protein
MNTGEDPSDSDFTLWGTTSGAEAPGIAGTPPGLVLEVSGGNPVSHGSRVLFGLPSPGSVRLAVYDVTGRCLTDLVQGHMDEGYHAVRWSGRTRDGSPIGPGFYFLRLDTGSGSKTTKAVVAN